MSEKALKHSYVICGDPDDIHDIGEGEETTFTRFDTPVCLDGWTTN